MEPPAGVSLGTRLHVPQRTFSGAGMLADSITKPNAVHCVKVRRGCWAAWWGRRSHSRQAAHKRGVAARCSVAQQTLPAPCCKQLAVCMAHSLCCAPAAVLCIGHGVVTGTSGRHPFVFVAVGCPTVACPRPTS